MTNMRRAFLILLLAAGAAHERSDCCETLNTFRHCCQAGGDCLQNSACFRPVPKLPAGVPVCKGPVKTAFSLRYQDIKIGTGAEAEPGKIYKVHYTGWLAADGHKFDSSYDHPAQPVMDKDGKMELDADGKPKLGEPQPISFPQGMGGDSGLRPGIYGDEDWRQAAHFHSLATGLRSDMAVRDRMRPIRGFLPRAT